MYSVTLSDTKILIIRKQIKDYWKAILVSCFWEMAIAFNVLVYIVVDLRSVIDLWVNNWLQLHHTFKGYVE